MRWQIGVMGFAVALVVFLGGLFVGTHMQTSDAVHSSAGERLQPATTVAADLNHGGTVYVPIYSSLDLGVTNRQRAVELAATVSVRNVSVSDPIVIEWVRYHDSAGTLIRDYLDKPSALPPLASVEFVVQRADTTGGPGANFLIRWKGSPQVDDPIIEAVMLGQSGNAGISFTSAGRVVKSAPGNP